MEVTPRFKEPIQRKSRLTLDRWWSKAVREKDGSQCQFPGCRRYDPSIHTHHIASRKQRPDLRHQIDNGVCLCTEHHQWVHAHPEKATEMGFINRDRYEKRDKNVGT